MHAAQQKFCEHVKGMYPERFENKKVLDSGSLDINGNNRYLFTDCDYTGLDIGKGPNVDVVCPTHLYLDGALEQFDTIISTEQLEHDKHWRGSVRRMMELLRPRGLLLITCAGLGRGEHGTAANTPQDSPYTTDYYHNVVEEELAEVLRERFWATSLTNQTGVDVRAYGVL